MNPHGGTVYCPGQIDAFKSSAIVTLLGGHAPRTFYSQGVSIGHCCLGSFHHGTGTSSGITGARAPPGPTTSQNSFGQLTLTFFIDGNRYFTGQGFSQGCVSASKYDFRPRQLEAPQLKLVGLNPVAVAVRMPASLRRSPANCDIHDEGFPKNSKNGRPA